MYMHMYVHVKLATSLNSLAGRMTHNTSIPSAHAVGYNGFHYNEILRDTLT